MPAMSGLIVVFPAFYNTGNKTQNHINNTIENLNKGNFYVTKISPRRACY